VVYQRLLTSFRRGCAFGKHTVVQSAAFLCGIVLSGCWGYLHHARKLSLCPMPCRTDSYAMCPHWRTWTPAVSQPGTGSSHLAGSSPCRRGPARGPAAAGGATGAPVRQGRQDNKGGGATGRAERRMPRTTTRREPAPNARTRQRCMMQGWPEDGNPQAVLTGLAHLDHLVP
jgi:hypothetical protein